MSQKRDMGHPAPGLCVEGKWLDERKHLVASRRPSAEREAFGPAVYGTAEAVPLEDLDNGFTH